MDQSIAMPDGDARTARARRFARVRERMTCPTKNTRPVIPVKPCHLPGQVVDNSDNPRAESLLRDLEAFGREVDAAGGNRRHPARGRRQPAKREEVRVDVAEL